MKKHLNGIILFGSLLNLLLLEALIPSTADNIFTKLTIIVLLVILILTLATVAGRRGDGISEVISHAKYIVPIAAAVFMVMLYAQALRGW